MRPFEALAGLRLGAVPYLNARPLVDGLKNVVFATPSELARSMEAGILDLATMPVGALLAHEHWVALRSLGIASDGPVRTVLVHPWPPHEGWSGVFHPDPASRTSNLLAHLELQAGTGRGVEVSPSGDRATNLPSVVIGDRAFQLDPGEALDLAESWKRRTGLPFVFALWVAGPSISGDASALRSIEEALGQVLVRNLARLDEICRSQQVVTPEVARTYLTENVKFRLDERFRAGVERFAREGSAMGFHDGRVNWAC